MKKLTKSDIKMNNMMASLIMVVIGLVGVFALSRSVYYDNNYTNDLSNVQNCGLVLKTTSSIEIQNCINTDLNAGGHDRGQAQIYVVAGTAMITAAVVSSLSVLQTKRSK